MKFPFVTRAHHQAIVGQLRSQIIGLARTVYEGRDVPEEFQLILGVEIPKRPHIAEPEPVKEKPLTAAQQAEEEEGERQQAVTTRLRSIARTNPSRLGPALEQVMKTTAVFQARGANPAVAQMFDQARTDALKK
jgi:hypothetical protein